MNHRWVVGLLFVLGASSFSWAVNPIVEDIKSACGVHSLEYVRDNDDPDDWIMRTEGLNWKGKYDLLYYSKQEGNGDSMEMTAGLGASLFPDMKRPPIGEKALQW